MWLASHFHLGSQFLLSHFWSFTCSDHKFFKMGIFLVTNIWHFRYWVYVDAPQWKVVCLCISLFYSVSFPCVWGCVCLHFEELVRLASTYGLVPSFRYKYDAVPGAVEPCSPLEHRYAFNFPSVNVINRALVLFLLITKFRKLKI